MPLWRPIFLACYGLSGAAALIYQVVWVRLFGLTLGHTVASSSIVLAAFMCGLALGAWAAGQLRLTPATSLARYAALEILIGVVAVALPTALSLLEPALASAYADGERPGQFIAVRAALSFVLLGFPAAAMGATFPLAVSWFVEQGHRERSAAQAAVVTGAGSLYAINTAGAAAGAVTAGFWLIPSYGARATTWTAVALNLAAAAGALWLLSRRYPPAAPSRPLKKTRVRASTLEPRLALASMVAALSGFGALVFEVTWTRLIAMIIGPTTYAFAIMAASFIIGIAAGSKIGVRLARVVSRRLTWLCVMLMVAATGTLLAAWFTALQVPLLIAGYVNSIPVFGRLFLRETVVLGLALTAASVAFGAAFTLALAAASPEADSAAPVARAAARVYTANTIGAVAGALAAGFFLIPRFGLESTFLHTSRLLIAAGAAFALTSGFRLWIPRTSAAMMAVVAASLFAGTFALPEWNKAWLAGGIYKYARGLDAEEMEIGLRAGRLEYYKEGAAGTVSVKTVGGIRSLAIDGKVDASNGGDMLTQRLLGLLPTLAHGNPRSALVIGLGSGVTAGSVIAWPTIDHLDVAEISPEVIEASSLFAQENGDVLRAPGVRLLVGDGRTHLQLTSRQYDVIVSEPSNPWMAGVAALFTHEFFKSVRERLTPGGIFCQWTHTYELDPDDLRSIVRTFASVFPNGTMWLVGDGDLLLIGVEDDDRERTVRNIEEGSRSESAAVMLGQAGVPPESLSFFLLSLYAGGPVELASFGRGSALQIDDRMDLEYSAARAMYAPPEGSATRLRQMAEQAARPVEIASALTAARADDWIVRARVALRAEAFGMAHDSFRRAQALDAHSVEALRGGATAAAPMGRLAEEIEWLRDREVEAPRNSAVRVALSYALAMAGDMSAAMAAAADANQIDPASPYPLEQLASILADVGDSARLQPVAEALMTRFPNREDSRYYNATSLFLRNRMAEAREETSRLLALNPTHARGHNLRGILCATAKDLSCAQSAFDASLRLNPRDASVYTNLGNIHLELGNPEQAIALFSEAVAIDPTAAGATEALRAMTVR